MPMSKFARTMPFSSTSTAIRLPTGEPSLLIEVGAKLSESCVRPEPAPTAPMFMVIGPPATSMVKSPVAGSKAPPTAGVPCVTLAMVPPDPRVSSKATVYWPICVPPEALS